ncbi:hypothetical protein [Shewanella sp. 30m-9]
MKTALCHMIVLFLVGCSSGNIRTGQSNEESDSSNEVSTNINPNKEVLGKASPQKVEPTELSSPQYKRKYPLGDMIHKTSKEHSTPLITPKEESKSALIIDVPSPIKPIKKQKNSSSQESREESITDVIPELNGSAIEEQKLPSPPPSNKEDPLNNISGPQTDSTAQEAAAGSPISAQPNEALPIPLKKDMEENVKNKSTKKWNIQRRVSSNKKIKK